MCCFQVAVNGVCRCQPGYYNTTKILLTCDSTCDDDDDDGDYVSNVCSPCPLGANGKPCVRCPVGPDGVSSTPLINAGYGLPHWYAANTKMPSLAQRMDETVTEKMHVYPCPTKGVCLGESFSVAASTFRAHYTNDEIEGLIMVTDKDIGPREDGLTTIFDAIISDISVRSQHPTVRSAERQDAINRRVKSTANAERRREILKAYYLDSTENTTQVLVTDETLLYISRSTNTTESAQVSATSWTNTSSTQYSCRDGHDASSPVCAVCGGTVEEYVGGSVAVCTSCEENTVGKSVASTAMVFAVAAFFTIFLPAKVLKAASAQRKQAKAQVKADGYIIVGSAAHLQTTMIGYGKIVVGHFQVIMQFPLVMEIQWPPTFKYLLDQLKILKGDIIGYLHVKCAIKLNMFTEFNIAMAIIPVAYILLLTIQAFRARKGRRKKLGVEGATDDSQSDHDQGGQLLNNMFILIFCIYPFLVTRICHLLDCAEYRYTKNWDQTDSEIWQQYDYSVNCDEPKYKKYRIFAYLMLLVYPIGLPTLAMTVFYKNRRRLLDASSHNLGQETDDDDEKGSLNNKIKRSSLLLDSIWADIGIETVSDSQKRRWWYLQLIYLHIRCIRISTGLCKL